MADSQFKKEVVSELIGLIREIWKGVKDNLLEKFSDRFEKSWREASKKYNGETIAILGPPAAGKTTLLKVLANPSIEEEYLDSYNKTEKESHEAINFEYKFVIQSGKRIPFRMRVRKNSDVGGELYIRSSHWASVIKDASVVIYLIDGPQYILEPEGVYKDRILEDFGWLLGNNQLLKPNFSIVLGFNKIDKVCKFQSYKKFSKDNAHHLETLKSEIINSWPDELSSHIQGSLFLSLTDRTIRAFTLSALVASFVGDEIISLYKIEEK